MRIRHITGEDVWSIKYPSTWTALQKEIAALFAKALSIDDIGISEDFFEMGGTSMLASKIAMGAMVKGLPIAYQDVFAYPDVEAFLF